MFDSHGTASGGPPSTRAVPTLDAAAVAGWVAALAGLTRDATDAERVDQIRALEELKAAAAAAQARASADLDASIRAQRAEAGMPAEAQGRGIASQVALARRESPVRGGRHLGLAKALVDEMPHTLAALASGRLSEWRATLLARETGYLSVEHRRHIDATLGGDLERLERLGDRSLVAEVKKLAYRLDPHSVVNRARKAAAERRVTCRPAPDTMAYLTALLPAKDAVAAYAALNRAAASARAEGDARTRGQVMADLLLERVSGRSPASGSALEVQLVMTDRALLRGDHEPTHLPGYGIVPAGLAREWLRSASDTASDTDGTARVWLRRLYTHPATQTLVAMDSARRTFPQHLRRFLVTRDLTCHTPWCDAPIRHADHAIPRDAGGPTDAVNGQGLCEQCNYAKQAPGWRSRPRPGPPHTVQVTTPTGHSYRSTAPPLPGHLPTAPSRAEYFFGELLELAG